MSATTTAFDLRTFLVNGIQRMGKSYESDLSHVPADKQDASPMGVARSAREFTAECAGFNRWVARMVRKDETQPTEEQRNAFYAALDTTPKALEAFRKSIDDLSEAVSNASDEDLARRVTMPWGAEAGIYEAVHMAIGHMMYHDGQLNYIQSLYGDGDNHWAE